LDYSITFYVENWQELIKKIKAKDMRPGVALRPGTPIEQVYPLVSLNITSLVILLLFMSLAISSMKKPTKEIFFTNLVYEPNITK
jgi:ribulose-phosphate 3-epimerase